MSPDPRFSDAVQSRAYDELWRLLLRPIPTESPDPTPPTDEPTDDEQAADEAA